MDILSLSQETIQKGAECIQKGGIVVFPSDTVYGLLCDATNERAVQNLINLKNRPFGKPISVFVDSFLHLKTLVKVNSHEEVLRQLLPGPFTIVLPSLHKVVPLLESERGTLGVRYPQYSHILNLLKIVKTPVTATSANISGRPPHYNLQAYIDELSEKKRKLISIACDAGKLPRNKPSTIVDLSGLQPKLLRKGDVSFLTQKEEFVTQNAKQTRSIARYILQREIEKNREKKPLIFILFGEMGVGKTIFAKGMGSVLGISDVKSPTYTVFDEYIISNHLSVNTFIHADLFLLESKEDLMLLELDRYLQKKTVWCVEWGEKSKELLSNIKQKAKIVFVDIRYKNEKERVVKIAY